jgi:hypothetical protein
MPGTLAPVRLPDGLRIVALTCMVRARGWGVGVAVVGFGRLWSGWLRTLMRKGCALQGRQSRLRIGWCVRSVGP